MPYTITNQTAKVLNFPPVGGTPSKVDASGTLVVNYLNNEMRAALDAGLITVSPALTGLNAYSVTAASITYSGGGIAAPDEDTPATATWTFSGLPLNNDTIVINGTTITFVASGATGNQVNIGADAASTIIALKAMLDASVVANLLLFRYSITATTLVATSVLKGTAANAYTSTENATNVTVSGANFAGGRAAKTVPVIGGGTHATAIVGFATMYRELGRLRNDYLAIDRLVDSIKARLANIEQ